MEAGLVVDRHLLDFEIRDVLGVVRAAGGRDEAVTDVGDVVEKVPGGGRAARVDLSADGAQVERPAITHISGRRGTTMALVGSGAGVGKRELWREAAGAGRNFEGIAVGTLPGVALHRGQA